MMSSQNLIRYALTAFSIVVLTLMIYINVHAMNRDVAADVQNGALLRMLEQFVDPESPGGAGALVTEDDDKSIKGVEKMVSEMKNKLDAMQDKLVSLSKRTAEMQALGASRASEEVTPLKATMKKAALPKDKPKKTEDEQVTPAANNDKSRPETESFPITPQGNLTGMNILLLYADDWTHHTLSSYHKTEPINTVLKTPVLDALAADGIRFTHNCVTTSVCWISRATLYTGQYMSRHKTKEPCCWNGGKKPKAKLPEAPSNWKELSFYEILARHGYHVGHAGKWGVYLPFDKNVDFNVEDDGWHYRKIGKKVWHITEKNEADALRFLVTRPRDKPFFLNTAFFATHAKVSTRMCLSEDVEAHHFTQTHSMSEGRRCAPVHASECQHGVVQKR